MTATQLLALFELQVSDVTELSTSEELSILNRIYQRVCSDRPWEFLKTALGGTMSGSGSGGFYITMPADFAFFYDNNVYTDNTMSAQSNAAPKVIFVGANLTPYQIINYGDRRQYVDKKGYCYLDFANSKIYFTGTPDSTTYAMDYIKFPATLTAGTSPIIPERFQDVLVYGMSVENEILQLSPKATSYAQDNQAKYNQYLLDLQYWNSQLQVN